MADESIIGQSSGSTSSIIPAPNSQDAGGTQQGGQTGGTTNDGVVVPDEAKKKYPDLVELILKSQSMNTQEQNYWLQVLPVMTPDQVAELRDILKTEKRKLAEIDAKYASGGSGGAVQQEQTVQVNVEEVEKKRREAQEKRRAEEAKHREEEQEKAEDLLAQLDDL